MNKSAPSLLVALGITGLGALLVPVIAVLYSYSALSLAVSGMGLVLLLGSIGFWWFYRRRIQNAQPVAQIDSGVPLGLALGVLWVIEISINNFIAPPLPGRDLIDNLFWALVALGILAVATVSAFRAASLRRGITSGIWSGYASGTVACVMGLAIVVFGMPLLLRDPLNLAEWADRGASIETTMASFLAYETFAGAFLHLIVLGIFMGALLGILGGVVGKVTRLALGFVRRGEQVPF